MTTFRYLILLVFFMHFSCGVTEPGFDYPEAKHIHEIHLLDLGKNTDTFLSPGIVPQFSLDSQNILFIRIDSTEESKRKIISMDVDNKSQKPITDSYQYLERIYCSPARPQLAFSARDFSNQSWDLYIVNEDGSGLVNITNTIDQNEYHPVFSPDGNLISDIQIDRNSGIYRLKLKALNGEPRTLRISDKNRLNNLGFTLNGTKIVYSEESNRADGPKYVRMIDVNDNTVDELLEGIKPTLHFTLNGRFVFNEGRQIKGYDLSNNEITDIVTGDVLALSPDGTKILFTNNRRSITYMLMTNFEGGAIDTLVADKRTPDRYNFSYFSVFSSNRSKIVYSKEYWSYE